MELPPKRTVNSLYTYGSIWAMLSDFNFHVVFKIIVRKHIHYLLKKREKKTRDNLVQNKKL